MASVLRPVLHLLQSTVYLARKRLSALGLAAVLPFVASHVVVLQARQIGMPERLALDALHGVLVLSYLTAAVRVAQGEAVGAARFGFAWPCGIRLPGVQALMTMGAVVLLIGLPAAWALHPLTHVIEDWAVQSASAWAAVPTVMVPEFVMTTLLALVLAAQTVKMPEVSKS
ncbi:MAG: hypothetical protein NUV50_13250 [Rhodospirillales bacterium]|nr:hypothetical protein [Rhodospirillales bacterium]